MAAYRAKYTKMEKEVFGRQLRQLMTDRGMTGADLARQATLHLPKGKVIGRDNISWYVNGRSIPQPIFMTALTRVLKVDEKFLLPRSHTQRKGEAAPPLLTDKQRIDESQNEIEHGMHRVARRDHHEGAGDAETCEQIKE